MDKARRQDQARLRQVEGPQKLYPRGIDTTIVTAASSGKKCGLGVSAGQTSPDPAVYDAGAMRLPVFANDSTVPGLDWMPLPWDPVFLNLWGAFIDAMGARYDGNPNLSYIVVSGFMQLMENHLTQTSDGYDRLNAAAKASGYGDLTAAYNFAGQTIIARFMTAFPTTAVLLTGGSPFPGENGNALKDWAHAQYPARFGEMDAFLKATLPPHSGNTNPPRAYPWGEQPIFATTDHARLYLPLPEPMPFPADPQPCDDLLANGAFKGNMFVELYQYDCRLVANWPIITSRRQELLVNVPAGH
jgi:hypothetical protein